MPHTRRTTPPCGNEDAMCAVVRRVPPEMDRLKVRLQAQRSNRFAPAAHKKGTFMNRLIYIIGAIVVIVAVLSFFGLR
jgi:hypothetical protein